MVDKEYEPTPKEQKLMAFKHWWKTDDPEWVAQRKREWKIIKVNAYSGEAAEMVKRYAHFYVYGDVLPRFYMGVKRDGRIPESDRLFMTPYETAEQLKELFESFNSSEKKIILLGFLMETGRFYEGLLPEVARHDTRLFIQEILSNRFAPWEIVGDMGRIEVVEADRPGIRAADYAGTCLSWLRGKIEGEYLYVVDAVEYFLGALSAREQIEDNDLEFVQKRVTELVALVMEIKDKPLEGYKRLLVDNLYEAFTREKVPLYIQQALENIKN